MKLQEVKCPNCQGSDVEAVSDILMKCRYCRTTFTIDYDAEDAQMDKNRIDLQMQREKFDHEDKMQQEEKKSLRFSGYTLLAIVFGVIFFFVFMIVKDKIQYPSDPVIEEKPAKVEQYVSDFSEIPDNQYDEMQALCLAYAEKAIDNSAMMGLTGDEPELYATYLLTSKEGEKEDTRIVFIYKDTWHKNGEDKETYVAYYLDRLQLLADGTVKYSNYPQDENYMNIWNNNFIDGEDTFDLCYTKAISANADYNVQEKK